MSDKASTAHMFNNMTLDIEQLLTKVVSILVTLLHLFMNVEHDIGTLQFCLSVCLSHFTVVSKWLILL